MAIDTELQLKAYELLITDLEKKVEEAYALQEKHSDQEVFRTIKFCDFIFRELGYKKLVEIAEIIDAFENDDDMKDYVETNYSEN